METILKKSVCDICMWQVICYNLMLIAN